MKAEHTIARQSNYRQGWQAMRISRRRNLASKGTREGEEYKGEREGDTQGQPARQD